VAVRVLTRDPARARHLTGHGVEVVRGDVRDPASVTTALQGADMVISAVHGFAGPGRGSPATVDRAGNAHLIGAATRAGANFILISVAGAAPDHPIGLFRAKHAAEDILRASGIGWTIVRATAFMQTWATIMSRMLQASGKIVVFGRGDNPVNFVSAADVAALIDRAVTDPGLRGQVLEIGGPDNLTFNQVAAILQETTGRHAPVRHIPRPALQAMAWLTAAIKPGLARQARAALVMDTIDMTFDPMPTRRALPGLPTTDMPSAIKELLA
jgi:NADH dehydrogenase